MRKHNFLIPVILLFLIGMPLSYAGTFTSLGNGGGAWTGGAATWTIVGDADGIPDPDDDVTIQAGDNITWNTTNKCRNLTINGTLTGSVAGAVIYISGNYIVTGTEAGTGQLVFQGANKTITATGTLGLNFPRWFFYANTTILSPSVVNKTVFTINPSVIVRNQGTTILNSATASAGSGWINDVGSSLTINLTGFMSGRTFDASAANNTVILKYATGSVPLTTAGYYNLTVAGTTAGVKTLGSATTVANALTINSTNTLSANGFDMIVGGNWTNNGVFTAGTNRVTLSGAGAQTIGGTASTTFYNLTKSAAGTTTLARNTIVTNLLTISSGIMDASTFGLSGAGGLTMTNGELRLAKTGATVPELTGAYSLTAGKVTFNGAGSQTIRGTVNYFNVDVTGSGTKTLGGIFNVNGSLLISSTLDASASSFDINLKGNWTNNGAFTAQSGSVNLIGTVAQTIAGTAATAFENLTLNNTAGATITSGSYSLMGALTLSNGTFNTGGRTFTMNSTAAKTARIAPITGTGAVAGNFTIERFITSRDTTWADLASPVQNATFADWESELVYVYYGYAPPDDYPTQWTFDEAADDFSPVTSAGTALTPGLGFEVFLTGDFSYSNLPNTTINAVGVPNQGDQDLSALVSFNGAGSNLVGNPFASSISWTSVFTASSGIMNTYDMYDYTAGNYSTYGLGTEIGSGQGFWVYATSGSPTLIVNESAKTASSNSTLKSSIVKESYFTLKLSSNDAGNNYYHILKVLPDNTSSDGWDLNDHPYRKSPNKLAPFMYTTIEGKKAVINAFNSSDDNYSMPVAVNAGIKGYYKIEASGIENAGDYSCIKLEDKTLNKMIDLTSGEAYSFELKPGDDADRFILHFSKSASCKSVAANSKIASGLDMQVDVLPTSEGNSISFNMTEATPAKITVTNVLGQNVIDDMSVVAETQTVNVALPQDFSGMYILRIESSKGVITKKYVRK